MANEKGESLFDAARGKDLAAAKSKAELFDARKAADRRPHDHDFNGENLATVKRENWNNSGSGREREGQK